VSSDVSLGLQKLTRSFSSLLSHPISDSIWLAYGTLLVGSGHQMCLYGLPRQTANEQAEEGLFEYVARLNGPLADYHPQMLLQCLLWGWYRPLFPCHHAHLCLLDKLDVVKEIIVNLARDVDAWHELHMDNFKSSTISIDRYFKKDRIFSPVGLAILYIEFY
jgi:hypothetical protein